MSTFTLWMYSREKKERTRYHGPGHCRDVLRLHASPIHALLFIAQEGVLLQGDDGILKEELGLFGKDKLSVVAQCGTYNSSYTSCSLIIIHHCYL